MSYILGDEVNAINKNNYFKISLNNRYKDLIRLIKSKKSRNLEDKHKDIIDFLCDCLIFIRENYNVLSSLDKTEYYILLNIINLAKSESISFGKWFDDIEDFQKISNNYRR